MTDHDIEREIARATDRKSAAAAHETRVRAEAHRLGIAITRTGSVFTLSGPGCHIRTLSLGQVTLAELRTSIRC
jgi:hypothetical protein